MAVSETGPTGATRWKEEAWKEAAGVVGREPCFGAVWVGGGPGAATGDTCDPCTLAGGLIEIVPRGLLGVVSAVGSGRHPAVLARDVTALDVVSGGRAAVLLRPTGPAPDGGASGGEADQRVAEAVAVCRAVMTEESPLFEGRHYHVAGAVNRPGPVRPGGPPLVVDLSFSVPVAAAAAGDPFPGTPAARERAAAPPLGSVPLPERVARLAAMADAVVVAGGADMVAACRAAVGRADGDRGALLWRGALGSGGAGLEAAADEAAELLDAGADGLVVTVAGTDGGVPATVGGLAGAVAWLAAALGPLVGRRW
ncbi:MAG: LLM class flavin-dependent oxidoreductase [Acidimicrobiales bacterium]